MVSFPCCFVYSNSSFCSPFIHDIMLSFDFSCLSSIIHPLALFFLPFQVSPFLPPIPSTYSDPSRVVVSFYPSFFFPLSTPCPLFCFRLFSPFLPKSLSSSSLLYLSCLSRLPIPPPFFPSLPPHFWCFRFSSLSSPPHLFPPLTLRLPAFSLPSSLLPELSLLSNPIPIVFFTC